MDDLEISPALAELYKLQNDLGEPVPCTNYPEAFSVEYGDADWGYTVNAAKSLCAQCPIRLQCLDYAMKNEDYNIWGGMTAGERARLQGRSRSRFAA